MNISTENNIDPSGPTINRSDNFVVYRENKPEIVQQIDAGLLNYERQRLETYQTWPMGTPVSAKELAKNGFYYTGTDDRVQCIFCKGILKDWKTGDEPDIQHKNQFPRCPFIRGINVRNVPLPPPNTYNIPSSNLEFRTLSDMNALGINIEIPKNQLFTTQSTRIGSFRNWPSNKHQTPDALAAAGFFFTGSDDNVKCFYCDGRLKDWEVGDDPWEEHARWFPKCQFVTSVKGQDFINNVQNKFKHNQHARAATGGCAIKEGDIKARMELPNVKSVLSTGVNKASVMKVIEKRLRETGDDFPNAEDLLEAAVTLEAQPQTAGSSTPVGTKHEESDAGNPNNSDGNDVHNDETPLEATLTMEAQPEGMNTADPRILVGTSHQEEAISNTSDSFYSYGECKVCHKNEVGIVFLPCGHLYCCVQCAPAFQRCPVCRAQIKGKARAYI